MGEIQENLNANPHRKTTVVALVIVILVIGMVWVLWKFGSRGIAVTVSAFLGFLLFVAFIGLIVFLVIKLLFKPKVNMIHVVGQRIKEGAGMREPPNDIKVYLQGDNKDYERKMLGLLKGISESVIPPKFMEVADDYKGKIETVKMDGKTMIPISKPQKLLFLLIKPKPFSAVKTVGVLRKDISNPSMDEVYIHDTTLSPPFGGILYPAKYDGLIDIVELKVKDYVQKYTLEDFLKDYKVIIDDAIQSSPMHQKDMERKGMMERIGGIGDDQNA